jgi:hypothetical protein
MENVLGLKYFEDSGGEIMQHIEYKLNMRIGYSL